MALSVFYITFALLFFAIWCLLFISYENYRPEMLYMSIVFAIAGPAADLVYFTDWWRPETLNQSSWSLESVICGFAVGGIASIIYDVCSKKSKISCISFSEWYKPGILFLITFGLIFLNLHFIFHLSAFLTTVVAYVLGLGWIYYYRPDLIRPSLLSGVYLTILGAVCYWTLMFIFDDYFDTFWLFHHEWYGTYVFGVPLAEYMWYFLTGAFIGPLFEFMRGICKST